jgi:putative ABC transport system ATP-binding protein
MDLFSFDLSLDLGKELRATGRLAESGVLVVQGPSGAGKSSLLRAFARLRPISRGEMYLDGQSSLDVPAPLWRRRIHYLSQQPTMFQGSVFENICSPYSLRIMSGKAALTAEPVEKMMERLMLAVSIDQDAQTLSGGEKARISLIKSMLAEPWLLLLDEPTASLDKATRRAVLDALAHWLYEKPKRGIVLVSHIPEDSEAFSSVSFIEIGPHAKETMAREGSSVEQ